MGEEAPGRGGKPHVKAGRSESLRRSDAKGEDDRDFKPYERRGGECRSYLKIRWERRLCDPSKRTAVVVIKKSGASEEKRTYAGKRQSLPLCLSKGIPKREKWRREGYSGKGSNRESRCLLLAKTVSGLLPDGVGVYGGRI